MVHRSREMKHLLFGIIAVLSMLAREQLLTSAEGCPRRYLRRINGKCYYFSVKKMNWFGALNNCLRKGLTLADLSNPRDFYGAIDFLSSKGNTEDFWFGGNDLQTEGRFQYISNGRLVRFYSNYSIVEPAEHSECDDCLEARIRTNMTVVAADNCQERQYFICSERYCASAGDNKPRHHSHEHLHHFHHDIGEPIDEEEEEIFTPSPFEVESTEDIEKESEEDAVPEGQLAPESSTEAEDEEGDSTTHGPEGEEPPAEGAKPADEDETSEAPAEGAAQAEGEAPAEGAAPAEGEAPAEGAAPAEGEAPAEGAAPAEGEAPAEGAATAEGETPAEGAAPAEGEAPAEGAAAAEGEAAPAEGATPAEGEAPAEGAAPAEGEAPTEGAAAAEGEAPAEGAAAAEGEAPAEGAAAAEGEAPAAEGTAPVEAAPGAPEE